MAILDPDGIAKLISDLRGHLIYPTAILALFTGMRLGEILALRWLNVALDAKLIRVREALEETRRTGSVSSPRNRRPGGVTSACTRSWSTRCVITGVSSLSSA